MKKVRRSTRTTRQHTHTPATIREILDESREKVRKYFQQRASMGPACELGREKRGPTRRQEKPR